MKIYIQSEQRMRFWRDDDIAEHLMRRPVADGDRDQRDVRSGQSHYQVINLKSRFQTESGWEGQWRSTLQRSSSRRPPWPQIHAHDHPVGMRFFYESQI